MSFIPEAFAPEAFAPDFFADVCESIDSYRSKKWLNKVIPEQGALNDLLCLFLQYNYENLSTIQL